MNSYFKLVRYKNLIVIFLITFLTKYSFLDSFISNSTLSFYHFILLVLSVVLFSASGYIINDILDQKTDAINRPNRCIVGVKISKTRCWSLFFLLSSIGLVSSFFLAIILLNNFQYFLFLTSPLLLFVLYSYYLKKIAFIGNLSIAICAAWIIILISIINTENVVHTSFSHAITGLFDYLNAVAFIIYYSFFAFVTTLIREIIKDIEDIDGDFNIGLRTLPVLIGRKRTRNVVNLLSILSIISLVFFISLFFEENYIFFSIYNIIFIAIPSIYFTYILWNSESKQEFSFLSRLLKLIMIFGILSMVIFKF